MFKYQNASDRTRWLVILVLWSQIGASATSASNKAPAVLVHNNENITDMAQEYADEYMQYLEKGTESDKLKELCAKYRQRSDDDVFSGSTRHIEPYEGNQSGSCLICRIVAEIAMRIIRLNWDEKKTEELARSAFQLLCQHLNLQTSEVCSGLFDLNWPILYYILRNSKAEAQTVCGIFPISFCEVEQPIFNWHVMVDSGRVPLTGSKTKSDKARSSHNITILHLTDIHYDPEYKAGAIANCREPLCCRATSSAALPSSENSSKAGYWGDYGKCDVPLQMVDNAFDHILEKHTNIDYIYLTGDMGPHNVWSTSRESNMATMSQVHEMVKKRFGTKNIYPVVGNHETHPVNVFGHKYLPPQFQINWLYNHLWSMWQDWLPVEAKTTILEGGYYSVSPRPGFRIIGLNNNDCYLFNWWLYYDGNVNTSLPQLQWLHDTLLRAEDEHEFVHILSHIPSGSADCWPVWARELNRIVERFSNTIGGIFNGHSHYDEMQVHYSSKGYAMMVSWNAGSLTPFTFKNPNYRLYQVEPSTYQVIDHSTWIFNLTAAKENGSMQVPKWFEEYHLTKLTRDLSPAGIDDLLNEMSEKPDILRQYWQYKMTSADPKLAQGCNDNCLLNTICNLAVAVYNEKQQCEKYKSKLRKTLS